MSRLATAFVLGYHGCEKATGLRAVNGETDLIHSDRAYDWLCPGAYFWESDPIRALEWAQGVNAPRKCADPFVIGAVIDLRNCLDLASRREGLEILRSAYSSFVAMQKKSGQSLPLNVSPLNAKDDDNVLRYLDCAVIKHLHSMIDKQSEFGVEITPYDSVRGLFTEGKALFPGSGFQNRTHVQIAIKNPDCIKGVFIPRPVPDLG